MFSPLTKQLIEALQALPGIGPKSAQRLAFYLLTQSNQKKGTTLSNALQQAIERIHQCQHCHFYTEETECELCRNPRRDKSLLCVVEGAADVMAIEQTHSYRGLYFVLQGHLSPLDGIGPNEIGIPDLLNRLKDPQLHEMIIATNPTMEGKATAHYIASHIDPKRIRCTRLAYGLPLGGELEYLDGGTLSHAFQARIPLKQVDE